MKIIEMFEAFDGTRFDDKTECASYESMNFEGRLVGLTLEQVRAALLRHDPELAEAIEEAGNRIAKLRRTSGELKRRPASAKVAEPVAIEEAVPAAPEDAPAPPTAPDLPPHDPETGEILEKPYCEAADVQSMLQKMTARFKTAQSQDELLDICDEERVVWYNDAPAMIRHQAEEAFDEARKGLPISAAPMHANTPHPPAPPAPPMQAMADDDIPF